MFDIGCGAVMVAPTPKSRGGEPFVTARGSSGWIYRAPAAGAPFAPAALAIGHFDGVHHGHRALLGEVVRIARGSEQAAGAVTFDRHPRAVLAPEREPASLSPLHEKVERLLECALDFVVVLHTDRLLLSMEAADFVDDLLVPVLDVSTVVVGPNFRFGRGATGDAGTLAELGRTRGFAVRCPRLELDGGTPVSSTRIRAALAAGDQAAAARMLGRR